MIVMLISFLLEGIFSNILKSPLLPLFSVVSIVVIERQFHNKEKKYLTYCFILGLLYDIVYTNTLFVNSLIFLSMGFITIVFFYFLSHRTFIDSLVTTIMIFIYRSLSFITNLLFMPIPFENLWQSIYNSLIINVIYCLILCLILKRKGCKR